MSNIFKIITPVKTKTIVRRVFPPVFSIASGISSVNDRVAIVPKAIDIESCSISFSFLAALAMAAPNNIKMPKKNVIKIPIYIINSPIINYTIVT
ncbi:MAG: hypothetical protein DBY08_04195 [Clostridiales bacterium]|nr:MAG: hypothetical protein DBY08_04195 [Clostridiales bacterium]